MDLDVLSHQLCNIRAPWIHKFGADVDVLAAVTDPRDGTERPVFVRQDNVLATSFHPELIGEERIHQMLLTIEGA